MLDDLRFYEGVLIPTGNALCYLVASDRYALLAHLVNKAAKGVTGVFRLLLILSIYLDGDGKYFHFSN